MGGPPLQNFSDGGGGGFLSPPALVPTPTLDPPLKCVVLQDSRDQIQPQGAEAAARLDAAREAGEASLLRQVSQFGSVSVHRYR